MLVGGFSECSGLEVETELVEYHEGGVNDYVHRFAGGTRSAPLVLRRGITVADGLWRWYQRTAAGQVVRRNGTIFLLEGAYGAGLQWNFKDAFPYKWTGPTCVRTRRALRSKVSSCRIADWHWRERGRSFEAEAGMTGASSSVGDARLAGEDAAADWLLRRVAGAPGLFDLAVVQAVVAARMEWLDRLFPVLRRVLARAIAEEADGVAQSPSLTLFISRLRELMVSQPAAVVAGQTGEFPAPPPAAHAVSSFAEPVASPGLAQGAGRDAPTKTPVRGRGFAVGYGQKGFAGRRRQRA